MRAISFDRVGGPEVLEIVDAPAPRPGPGQVAIEVAFAGVNYAEIMFRRGDLPAPLPFIPGLEVAGTVCAVGADTDPALLGQPVAAMTTRGGYAEVALAPAAITIPLVGTLSAVPLEVAAGLPCALVTAWGVLECGHLQKGESVLVHAAAGGVGTAIGQLARHRGAGLTIGVVSTPEKSRFAERHGRYDAVVLAEEFSSRPRALSGGKGFDLICDSVGGAVRSENLDLLAPLGRLVVFGNASAAPDMSQNLLDLQRTNRTVAGYNVAALAELAPQRYREHALAVLELIATGIITPHISEVLPLAAVRDAHAAMEQRHTSGKLLLRVR